MKHSELKQLIKEEIISELNEYTPRPSIRISLITKTASDLIDKLRDTVYPELNDEELYEFRKIMVTHLGGTLK
jgi:hypothetical protein